jgi:hypothetical protein
MRFPRLLLFAAVCIAAVPLAAQQPALTCASGGSASGRGCELFHYHVVLYRPDTKQHVEISATPQFATQAACERARDAKIAANGKVVEFIRTLRQQQYDADRYGPCHCDMTSDKSNANFLADAQRTAQLRLAEEIRLRVRERLLDMKLVTDNEVVRSLDIDPPVTSLLGAPKLVPLPPTGQVTIATAPDDLRPTRTIDTSKPTVTALDLPLVDPLAEAPPAPPPPVAAADVATPVDPAATPPVTAPPAPSSTIDVSAAPVETAPAPPPAPEAPIDETVVEVPVQAQPQAVMPEAQGNEDVSGEEDTQSAEEIAAKFIEYETQRINNVLQAASNITDPDLNTRIYQACIQRIHLLSNLRLLIEGAGTRSRLAGAARDASTEEERLALIGKLFGSEIKDHWAPSDAKDVIFDIEENVANAPERVLRDSAFTAAQKKQALYLVLAQTEPTEDQRLWLSTVIEGFLR